jgi:hypothetical protein
MGLPRSAIIAAIALAIPLCLFLWFAHAADAVMDKSGLGNLTIWSILNARAAASFWVLAAVWLCVLCAALFAKGRRRKHLLSVCAGFALAAPLAYVATLVLA